MNRNRNRNYIVAPADDLTIRTIEARHAARRRSHLPALLLIVATALALAFIVWTFVSAAPVTDPPVCPPGATCEPLGTPYPPPQPYPPPYPGPDGYPGPAYLPFVAEESYP